MGVCICGSCEDLQFIYALKSGRCSETAPCSLKRFTQGAFHKMTSGSKPVFSITSSSTDKSCIAYFKCSQTFCCFSFPSLSVKQCIQMLIGPFVYLLKQEQTALKIFTFIYRQAYKDIYTFVMFSAFPLYCLVNMSRT